MDKASRLLWGRPDMAKCSAMPTSTREYFMFASSVPTQALSDQTQATPKQYVICGLTRLETKVEDKV
ncbi:hypothetical protein Lal_00015926 [Lupinus albus]|nr:hypothetical protein Lal_00015926 [Lupinus albus]